MAKRKMFCDKQVLTLAEDPKNPNNLSNYEYSRVKNVEFDTCEEKKFFKKVPSEKIVINMDGKAPIVYTKLQEKDYFESYKEDLKKASKDHGFKLINKLEN